MSKHEKALLSMTWRGDQGDERVYMYKTALDLATAVWLAHVREGSPTANSFILIGVSEKKLTTWYERHGTVSCTSNIVNIVLDSFRPAPNSSSLLIIFLQKVNNNNTPIPETLRI